MSYRWVAIAGCWLVWGLFNASRLRLVIPDVTWSQSLFYSLPDAALWAALTPIPLALARRFPIRADRWASRVPLHLAGALGVALVHSVLDAALNVSIDLAQSQAASFPAMLVHLLRHSLHSNLMLYFAIVGIYQFIARTQRLRERERLATELRAQLTQARLDALQMQLRPHFLFNALNTVSGLVEEDAGAARRVLRQLGDVLRMILQREDCQEVSVRQELDLVRAYLEIQSTRFGDRLQVGVDATEETLNLAVPSFLLQPLVENAVTHGTARRSSDGQIEIAARRVHSRLVLTVRDNGPDGEGGSRAQSGQGIGLANIRDRLSQLYPGEHELRALRSDQGGWTVTVSIPARPVTDPLRRSA